MSEAFPEGMDGERAPEERRKKFHANVPPSLASSLVV